MAARPLLDYHRLDAYFALYAPDSSVPWGTTTVRLDTYTSAPVTFTAYQVDPADVIVAGANTRPRAVNVRGRKPLATWRYTPPGGYRFQSNDVVVPLGSREGFFVIEARRGDVGEQVWINRTRVGLLTKETPSGLAVYGTDLGTGAPLAHMRVSFVVNRRFSDRFTDKQGLVRWSGGTRPIFALAQWGASYAFVSFLPQAPLPRTIVGLKTDSAVVHAGETLHVVGFARSRGGGALRATSGNVHVTLRSRDRAVAQTDVRLDAAGAFAAALSVPRSTAAGEYTAVASAGGATAATAVHVDASAAGLALDVATQCGAACDSSADVPIAVRALRNGTPAPNVDVRIDVVRSPHVFISEPPDAPWGLAKWFEATVRTGNDGSAVAQIPHPSDGLSSTYGVRVESGGATADTRVVVPTAPVTLHLQLDRDDIGSGTPASFEIAGNQVAGGAPAPHLPVRVQFVHGASVQEQTLTLDERGRARGAFTSPQVGSNLIVARADIDGKTAMDAAQIQVEPQTVQLQQSAASASVAISLDRARYSAGDEARVTASLPGSRGYALLTLESAQGTDLRVVRVSGGRAQTSFRVNDAPGVLSAGAAFVADGTLQWSTLPLTLDAPGRPLAAALTLDRRSYDPGATATLKLAGVRAGAGTIVVRITKGAPSGSALFENAPDLLAIGTTTTQDSAIAGASWHPWVDSTGDHAVIQTFARRTAPPADLTMTQADTASVYWKIDRGAGDSLQVPVPAAPGRYVLSLLKIGDDGRVTAASGDLDVQ